MNNKILNTLKIFEKRINKRIDSHFYSLEKQIFDLDESVCDLEARLAFKMESLDYGINSYFHKVSKDHANLHVFLDNGFIDFDSRLSSLEDWGDLEDCEI